MHPPLELLIWPEGHTRGRVWRYAGESARAGRPLQKRMTRSPEDKDVITQGRAVGKHPKNDAARTMLQTYELAIGLCTARTTRHSAP
jgi:hypothetical protein